MKEYLLEHDGKYELHKGGIVPDGAIEVPEGAIKLMHSGYRNDLVHFINSDGKLMSIEDIQDENGYWYESDYYSSGCFPVLWSRFTQSEQLPFVDDGPQSLNDQYAEIEKVRHAHYFKDVSDIDEIDVYEVLHRFGVTDPCLQHIVKKALCAGERGHKDFHTDLKNIADTAKRMLEIHGL